MKYLFYINESNDPYETLALEEALVDTVAQDEIILYLYIHKSSIIIGKYQNPWAECDMQAIKQDDVALARRISGGGAVYHDPSNLNFSFIMRAEHYDLQKQLSVIIDAVKTLGIHAEFSGRNDITTDGRKFSGNAFCHKNGAVFHHGTILINTDMSQLSKYLKVSPQKMQAKGVKSVRSRVCNLHDISEQATVENIVQCLQTSFEKKYGALTPFAPQEALLELTKKYLQRNASEQWRIKKTPPFDAEFSGRFEWGGVDILLSMKNAHIKDATIYSDALDVQFIESVKHTLLGLPYDTLCIKEAFCQKQDSRFLDLATLF